MAVPKLKTKWVHNLPREFVNPYPHGVKNVYQVPLAVYRCVRPSSLGHARLTEIPKLRRTLQSCRMGGHFRVAELRDENHSFVTVKQLLSLITMISQSECSFWMWCSRSPINYLQNIGSCHLQFTTLVSASSRLLWFMIAKTLDPKVESSWIFATRHVRNYLSKPTGVINLHVHLQSVLHSAWLQYSHQIAWFDPNLWSAAAS